MGFTSDSTGRLVVYESRSSGTLCLASFHTFLNWIPSHTTKMFIKEFRVVMPVTVEEYQVGQLFAVAEESKNNTGGGEGIEVLKNEPFEGKPLLGGKFSKGQYTYKIYHLASKVPAFIRLLVPKGALEVHEEAWNAYPYCRTVISNPGYMKENFYIVIETMHYGDAGVTENIHELSPDKLKIREVVMIDIANDPVLPAEFKWFGVQTRVESFIMKAERRLFTSFHRQVFCWLDRWHGMTMQDIRRLEDETREELDRQRNQGAVRGMKADSD